MKRNKGFTIIELIIVIVIAGILAATATPKFISLSTDARVASIESLTGALIIGANLVHNKAVIEDVDSGSDYLDVDNNGTDDISIRSGYPRVQSSCSVFTSGLSYWMSMSIDVSCGEDSNADWYGLVETNMFHFMPSGYTSTDENCYVTYTTASERVDGKWEDTDSADVSATTSGCSN